MKHHPVKTVLGDMVQNGVMEIVYGAIISVWTLMENTGREVGFWDWGGQKNFPGRGFFHLKILEGFPMRGFFPQKIHQIYGKFWPQLTIQGWGGAGWGGVINYLSWTFEARLGINIGGPCCPLTPPWSSKSIESTKSSESSEPWASLVLEFTKSSNKVVTRRKRRTCLIRSA